MIDAVHPLQALAGSDQGEIADYAESWMPRIDDD
jgi:hypothetical protein